ncbi:MAG: UvrD-helicase domain-containing protein, partial [Myxococcales bacterium]|nr:UvrD-helicase domain-containing protein [Myxococcales bacterium]
MRTAIADWKPVDKELEPNALRVVRSTSNHLVVAGPGAGKTELLAQRACFLLETNSCRVPRRILALCFKRDAARALRERVVLRCGPEAGRRFVSKTYDSFVKGMIDRLSSALPEEYRPSKPYRLVLSDADLRKEIDRALRTHAQGTDRRGFVSTNTVKQIFYTLPKKPFPLEASPTDAGSVLLLHVWAQLLAAKEGSALNFRLLTRLAEYLFATSTALRRALHATYSHVFLDEFQDTTGIQYDLVRGLFGGSQ